MIGVLDYGSLITDPSPELDAVTVDAITDMAAPFSVKFARSSGKRGAAPDILSVEEGGRQVQVAVFRVSRTA